MLTLSDAEINDRIQSALDNTGLNKNVDINYKVNEGHLSLWGIVDVLGEKTALENILSKIPGIVEISNNLTVAMDRVISDDELAQMVTEKMEKDPRINLHNIGAIVKNGIVTLVGNADNLAEEKAAILAAEGVQGVKEVYSQVKIDEEFDDATITNSVELELSRTIRLNVSDVKVETRHGTVYLHGKVDTLDQIEAALQTAYRVKGVKEVNNQLIARHGESEGDTRLTNEVRMILGENGLSSIQAFVVNGILFLDGFVTNADQKHKASELVTKIPGITGINDSIVVTH